MQAGLFTKDDEIMISKEYRDRYRNLDQAKNNQEFDALQPEFLDFFAEAPVFTEALATFKESVREIEELKQYALQQIREKNSKAEAICHENGVQLPLYSSGLPYLESVADSISHEKFKQLSPITEFQVYEQKLLPLDIPLVMSLHHALFKTKIVMEKNGLSLEENANNLEVEPDYYELWLRLWHEKMGFVIYNWLRLLRDNPYGSALPQRDLPFEILEESCGLDALKKMSLPVPSDGKRLTTRKLIVRRLNFYAQRLYDQVSLNPSRRNKLTNVSNRKNVIINLQYQIKDQWIYVWKHDNHEVYKRFKADAGKGRTLLEVINAADVGILKIKIDKKSYGPKQDAIGLLNKDMNKLCAPRSQFIITKEPHWKINPYVHIELGILDINQ